MSKKILVLVSLLFIAQTTFNTTLACNGGCKGDNCGAAQQSSPQEVKEEKVQCPVMKNWILASEAADKTEYNGKTYYFCCEGCKEKFLAEPEKYISELLDNSEFAN